ncbi:MAG: type II secretion system F family protein [Candidatus Woesearchaeota archaeon]
MAIDFVRMFAGRYPGLKRILLVARIRDSPEKFVSRSMMLAMYFAVGLCILGFLFFSKSMGAKVIAAIPAIFLVGFFLAFVFMMNTPQGVIRRRQKDIDKEVLFAGRYLLVKMESGSPLYNSLIDASKSYGVAGKYFREIIDDISAGTNIEDALEHAREYTSSEYFKKILWQLIAALKTGTDVTVSLRNTLKVIADSQIIEIKEYGKKLNALMLFYMLAAIVVPSLGITLAILVASFMNLSIPPIFFLAVLFFLSLIQLFFIMLVRSNRPMMEL